jgi:large subunit ribosomal protein L21
MPTTDTSYAIVRTGGKQYRVTPGQELLVEKLTADVDSTVELEPLLLAGDGDSKFGDAIGKAKVTATVVGHEKGPKVRIFKFKPKRGYKKRQGHRQQLTRLRVDKIG